MGGVDACALLVVAGGVFAQIPEQKTPALPHSRPFSGHAFRPEPGAAGPPNP